MSEALRRRGALVLVGLSGFFVSTEFSITRVRLTQVQEPEKSGTPGVKAARHAVENTDACLAACQLGISPAPPVDEG